METQTLLQPLLRSLSISSKPLLSSARTRAAAAAGAASPSLSCPASRRHQSSTSRTKRALKISPHPSFASAAENHVIYNPPASSASVYHTPFKFLPRSDPRRKANLAELIRGHSTSTSSSSTTTSSRSSTSSNTAATLALPPVLHPHTPKYNVTREQVDEMRELRAQDPELWSVLRLAERYQCGPLFVMMCCRPDRTHRDRQRERLDAVKARWGPARAQAREERQKRKALLLRDAL
ncbi:hypothetical protein AAE478_007088 [Parahypoxylon ruwenzoriense]